MYRKERLIGEGDPQAVRLGFTASGLQATADSVGGRHLSLLILAYESSLLRRGPPKAPQPCRELEILKVQRTLPGMLADGHALAGPQEPLQRFSTLRIGRHLPAVLGRSKVLSDDLWPWSAASRGAETVALDQTMDNTEASLVRPSSRERLRRTREAQAGGRGERKSA